MLPGLTLLPDEALLIHGLQEHEVAVDGALQHDPLSCARGAGQKSDKTTEALGAQPLIRGGEEPRRPQSQTAWDGHRCTSGGTALRSTASLAWARAYPAPVRQQLTGKGFRSQPQVSHPGAHPSQMRLALGFLPTPALSEGELPPWGTVLAPGALGTEGQSSLPMPAGRPGSHNSTPSQSSGGSFFLCCVDMRTTGIQCHP